MAENVVDIKIKAKVDTKELQAEMKQIAETSKTSIEQSYKNLEVTMRKSVEALGGDLEKVGRNINLDSFVQSFKDQMKQLNKEIEQTGNLPLGMTSKMFDSMQAVDRLINKYVQLKDVISKMETTFVSENTAERAKIERDLAELNIALKYYEDVRDDADRLIKQYRSYQSLANTFSFTRGRKTYQGQDALKDYEDRKRKIEETKVKIEELRQASKDGVIPEDKIKSTNAEINRLEKSLRGLLAVQSQISERSAETLIDMREHLAKSTGIADLKAALKAEDPLQALKDSAAEAKSTITSLTKGIKRETDNLEKANSATVQQDENFNKIAKEVRETGVEIVKAATYANELAEKSQKAGDSFGHLRAQIRSFERVLAGVYTVSRDAVTAAKKIANIYKQIWNIGKKVLSVFKQMRDKIRGTASEHTKSWKMMLRDILRYSLGIRSLFALFRRLRKYIKEAFEAMAEQIPEVNALLSNLKSSFGMLKGSLATAFEPILSAIAPALERLINLLSTAITYIGMFWAALTGRGYVYKATKAIQNVAGAAKEMNKQLQGFDELNNLTSDKGGGADNPLANFEKVDVADWIKDLVDKIKDIARQIFDPIKKAWDLVGDYVVDSWKHAVTSIKDLLADIGRDFLKAWAEDGTQIFINIFNIIGDIGNAIGYIADALRRAWKYNNNGYKIWKAILDIVERITYWVSEISLDFAQWTRDLDVTPAMTAFREWLESLVPVADAVGGIMYDFWHDTIKPILNWTFNGENSGIAKLFNIFRDFNKKIDWDKLRDNLDKIWQALGRFGETVGEGLLLFIQGLADELANWINSDDFANTCDKIVEFFDNIDKYEIADDLDQILDTIKNIAEWIWKAISYVIDHKDEILDTLQFISEHLDTIVGLIVGFKLALDSIRLGADVVRLITFFKEPESSFSGFSSLIGKISESGPAMTTFFEGLGVVGATVALGYAMALKANEALEPILKENQQTFEDLKKSVDDIIPTYEQMSQASREASRNQKEYAQHMQEMYDAVLVAHPELKNLNESLEDNGFKTKKNIDTLNQINEGLKIFKTNGGDAKSALEYLSDTYGNVDKNTKKFFDELDKGNSKATTVADSMTYLADETKKAWDKMPTSKDTEKFGADSVKGYGEGITKNEDTYVKGPIQTLASNIVKWFHGSALNFGSPSVTMMNFGKDTIIGFNNGMTSMQSSSMSVIQSYINNVVNAFTGMRNSVLNIFSNLASNIGNIMSSIASGVSSVMNSIANTIGNLKSNINNITSSISSRFNVHIPRLAQGAVIPPNNEFLAVLGDQKRGTNIETPLSTMVEAFNMANKGGSEQELALLQEQNDLLRQLLDKEFGISGDDIFRSVRNSARTYKKSTGNSAFA